MPDCEKSSNIIRSHPYNLRPRKQKDIQQASTQTQKQTPPVKEEDTFTLSADKQPVKQSSSFNAPVVEKTLIPNDLISFDDWEQIRLKTQSPDASSTPDYWEQVAKGILPPLPTTDLIPFEEKAKIQVKASSPEPSSPPPLPIW